jgi:hypothetical protein
VFYLLGTRISDEDAGRLLGALVEVGSPEAFDAAEMIARGMTGRRDPVPLTPAMQEAVYTALGDDPPDTLVDLRNKARRRALRVKEW